MYEADLYLNGPENDAWGLNAFPEHINVYEPVFHTPMHLTNGGTEIRIDFDGVNGVTAV